MIICLDHRTIDLGTYRIHHPDGSVIELTYQEREFLVALAEGRGRVISYELLGERAWGEPNGSSEAGIRCCVGRLRRKLGDDGAQPRYIQVVRRAGYRLNLDVGEAAIQ